MLATSLPSLPPPTFSLLPTLHDQRTSESANTSDGQNSSQQTQQQQQQSRARASLRNLTSRNQLAILSSEEQILEQRKQAIQTFGYSWLKPAGCTKTMLGRREEDIEREEVERQLREVELQERNAAEVEEAERVAHQQQQRAQEDRGEVITGEDGDHDLDDEVPDMDAQDDFDEEDEEEEEVEDDLDDDIPEGDSGFAYDTTRDPDTESEGSESVSSSQIHNRPRPRPPSGPSRSFNNPISDLEDHEQEAIATQMLDEDELGAHEHEVDLDDDIPDMDEDIRDLDDDVPNPDDEDGGWEHTDTELEESDMDISVLPQVTAAVLAQRHQMLPPSSSIRSQHRSTSGRQSTSSQQSEIESGLRRTSGNVPLPMAPPSSTEHSFPPRRGLGQPRQMPPHYTPAQIDSDISVSALISTGNTGVSSIGATSSGAVQRAWLDPASARRNLFGASRNVPIQGGASINNTRGTASMAPPATRTLGTIPNFPRSQGGPNQANNGPIRQVSSGGLFTPSPQQQRDALGRTRAVEEPRSRTRSGRLLGFGRS